MNPALLAPPEHDQSSAAHVKSTERAASAGFIGFLKILLATLAVLCIFEGCARILVFAFLPAEGSTQIFDRKLDLAKRRPDGNLASILFIGNSIGAFGTYADLIAAELSEAGYRFDVRNLCTVFSGPSERLFLLQTAVQSGVKPAIVICDFDAVDFQADRRNEKAKEDLFLNSSTGSLYLRGKPSLSSFFSRLLIDRSYLYTSASFLRSFLCTAPKLILHPDRRYEWFPFSDSPIGGDWSALQMSKCGWVPSWTAVDQSRLKQECDMTVSLWPKLLGPKRASWFSIENQRSLIDYCSKNQIPLVYIWHPMYPLANAQKREVAANNIENLEDVGQQMRVAVRSLPHTYFFDFHNSDSNWAHYSDMVHQNPAGAVPFSERLVRTLLEKPNLELLKSGSSPDTGRRPK